MLPICVNFDQISAVADLLAHGAPGLLHAAYHLGTRGKVREIRRDAERVVLTHGGDRASGDLHARAVDQSLLDGITECDVGVARSLILDVANGGKARVQSNACVGCTLECTKSL
jgi:hypothetical protein